MLINHLIDGVCMDPLILAMIIEGLGGGTFQSCWLSNLL